MSKVEIRPLPIPKWHGKQGKESFARPTKIRALVDTSKNEYSTGLTPQEVKEYSKLLQQDLSPIFKADKPHEFWDGSQAFVKLLNSTQYLDTSKPLDFIRYKICKASPFVANSMKEWEEGKFPRATHVLYDELEEIEMKASKVALKTKATIECAKLSLDKKVQLILIIEGKIMKGKSSNFVDVVLSEMIDKKAEEILMTLNMEAEDLYLKSLVLEALQKNVLRRENYKIKYFDSSLGSEVMDVVQLLKKPDNEQLKLHIVSAINS
jgi:hypothetical protein